MSRRAPRHSEHDMERNRKSLGTVNMCIGWGVRDDSVRDERGSLCESRINACLPAAAHDLGDHPPVAKHIAVTQTVKTGDKSRISDHVLRVISS